MKLVWLPSKKALDAGIVPKDYSQYDIDTNGLKGAELKAIMASIEVAATVKMRHAYNNESAAAWLAAKTAEENPIADTPENRATFLHEWRVKWRNAFIEGKLGLRRVSVTPPKDEFTVQREIAGTNIIREFAKAKGFAFPDGKLTPKTLALEYCDSKRTIAEVLADVLESKKWKAKIDAEAQKVIDDAKARELAAKDAVASSESNTLDDLLGEPDDEESGEAAE